MFRFINVVRLNMGGIPLRDSLVGNILVRDRPQADEGHQK